LIPQEQLIAIANDFWAAQSSRLAEFGGLGISFNISRGTAWQLGDVGRSTMAAPRRHPSFGRRDLNWSSFGLGIGAGLNHAIRSHEEFGMGINCQPLEERL
jgi:hypothetical protein